jgi:hypothetical protein
VAWVYLEDEDRIFLHHLNKHIQKKKTMVARNRATIFYC